MYPGADQGAMNAAVFWSQTGTRGALGCHMEDFARGKRESAVEVAFSCALPAGDWQRQFHRVVPTA